MIDSPPMGRITCSRFQNSNGYFDIQITLLLDNYLLSEEAVDFIEIIPKIVELDDSDNIIDQDSYPIIHRTITYTVIQL